MSITYKNPYRETLLAAEEELQQLENHISLEQQRVNQLKNTIAALRPLAEGTDALGPELGLTDACRRILIENANRPPITAPDVRSKLALMGIDISGYSNPMAVLHSTLRRIAQPRKTPNGETGYMFIHASPRGTLGTPPPITAQDAKRAHLGVVDSIRPRLKK